jgi:hypothetical protein
MIAISSSLPRRNEATPPAEPKPSRSSHTSASSMLWKLVAGASFVAAAASGKVVAASSSTPDILRGPRGHNALREPRRLLKSSNELNHGNPNGVEPPRLGKHYAKGGPPRSGTSLLNYNQGAIMPSVTAQAIFWGPKWSDSTFAQDKISGLDKFFAYMGTTNYANSSAEYTGTNGRVGNSINYLGHLNDTSAAPAGDPGTTSLLAEVCKVIPSPSANGDGYYPVFSDQPRGGANYCAYHTYGACNSVPITAAFHFLLDGDAGCNPQDSVTGHSQGLAALANVGGHEISEARTDPRNGGWYDASGYENADKCAWTFAPSPVTFTDGTQWKIQGNWGNAAYKAGIGYVSGGTKKLGCIDGNQ